jgi:hypothetical protein
MRSVTPGEERDNRPPVAVTAAPSPGVAGRRSVQRRTHVAPRLIGDVGPPGFPVEHPYVRRFWTAALGPGAVADLLRLMVAARQGRSLLHPEYLHLLTGAGLVFHAHGSVWVRPSIPPLDAAQLRRMTPAMRTEHAQQVEAFLGRR